MTRITIRKFTETTLHELLDSFDGELSLDENLLATTGCENYRERKLDRFCNLIAEFVNTWGDEMKKTEGWTKMMGYIDELRDERDN
jgi:hypothetical protein